MLGSLRPQRKKKQQPLEVKAEQQEEEASVDEDNTRSERTQNFQFGDNSAKEPAKVVDDTEDNEINSQHSYKTRSITQRDESKKLETDIVKKSKKKDERIRRMCTMW